MKRVILGALLGAVVMFCWGAVFWMALPFGGMVLKGVENEDALTAHLRETLPSSGVYYVPFCGDSYDTAAQEKVMARHRAGPLVRIFYIAEGREAMAASSFFAGFAQMFVSSLMVGWVLHHLGFSHYLARLGLVTGAGLFLGITAYIGDSIWFFTPWDKTALDMGFSLTSWIFAGLVMAATIRPIPHQQARTSLRLHAGSGQSLARGQV